MKKRVRSSNVLLRFYKHDGWTREVLEPYLLKGKLVDTEEYFGDPKEIAYFVMHTGELDIDRLYTEQVSEVHRLYDDRPSETDLEFMKRMSG